MDLAIAPIRVLSAAKVPAARHKIHRIAATVVTQERADDVELMVAEALGNALLHGRGGAFVTVTVTATVLRVEVRDHGPGLAVARRADHGRGLTIINALAARWDLITDEGGTRLCFEVNRVDGEV
jgi:anti-sigma regulatory factor (Ser/Thr protein kinase)